MAPDNNLEGDAPAPEQKHPIRIEEGKLVVPDIAAANQALKRLKFPFRFEEGPEGEPPTAVHIGKENNS